MQPEPRGLLRDKMGPSIFLITGFVVFFAEWPYLAEADDLDARSGNPKIFEIAFSRTGSLFSQHEIVGLGTPLVTMSFDENRFPHRVLDPQGIGFQNRLRISSDCVLVEIEEDVSQAGTFFHRQ